MSIADLPLINMLKTRMHWHHERQNVLAENVANADTPGFRARDLRALTFPPNDRVDAARTDPAHLASFEASSVAGNPARAGSFETVPSGNSVVLEDEMIKIGQNQSDYQAVASLYQQSLALIRSAIGKKA